MGTPAISKAIRILQSMDDAFKVRIHNKQHNLQIKYKEAFFGKPPCVSAGRLVEGTGAAPDMDLIDKLFK